MRRLSGWLVAAALVAAATGVGCDRGEQADSYRPEFIEIDGRRVPVDELARAVTGLCLASRQIVVAPAKAREAYSQQSAGGVDLTARALAPANELLVAEIRENVAMVESTLAAATPPPMAGDHFDRLAANMREGLARLGVSVPACPD